MALAIESIMEEQSNILLVIENLAELRRLAAELESVGAHVMTTRSLTTAGRYMRETPVAVAVVDLRGQDADGPATVQRLREMAAAALPVLLIAQNEAVDGCYGLGNVLIVDHASCLTELRAKTRILLELARNAELASRHARDLQLAMEDRQRADEQAAREMHARKKLISALLSEIKEPLGRLRDDVHTLLATEADGGAPKLRTMADVCEHLGVLLEGLAQTAPDPATTARQV